MKPIELKTDPSILSKRGRGLIPLARAIQAASRGQIAITLGGARIADLEERPGSGKGNLPKALKGINVKKAGEFLGKIVLYPLRPGKYPIEDLLALQGKGQTVEAVLKAFYEKHLDFIAADIVPRIESRLLKVFLLGSAGTGVVSAVQDMVTAFSYAGYHGRAFPLFDPSKKGAPVHGYGIVSRDPILSHAAFEVPNIVLLFDEKLFPLLRLNLANYKKKSDPEDVGVLVNTAMDPAAFRAAADFRDPFALYTLDADLLVKNRKIPPNYAMIGGMLGILGEKMVDSAAFTKVVKNSLTEKFGPGSKVDANIEALAEARKRIKKEKRSTLAVGGLGPVKPQKIPEGHEVLCEDGNRAIARAVALVLNQFPSVVAAYPITPQTQIVEHLAQMMADGTLSAEGVTPESEHGAGGAVLGAARDRVLAFTATCSQGFALMSEIVHTIAGLRMGNVLISNVVRSLNSPLDVENDHSDLYKIGLDAGFIVLMTRDVQQAFDFHLMAYLVSLYAEYRRVGANGESLMEMIPDRSVMLPAIVASEGFEVSHAPERYLALKAQAVEKLYNDPDFDYVRTFINTPNKSIMGALQLSNARMETDYQRHVAMGLALEVLGTVFKKFADLTGRRYDFIHAYNIENSKAVPAKTAPVKTVFVVAGAAYGAFEEVARELHKEGIQVGVAHPNVLRPFPKAQWKPILQGRSVFVYDRDDPYGATGGRLYSELAGVVNEYGLAGPAEAAKLYSRIYGLGGRTPSLSLVRDEMLKALRHQSGEIHLTAEKQYVGVSL